jgi:rRNA maturation endonuclease Nob1
MCPSIALPIQLLQRTSPENEARNAARKAERDARKKVNAEARAEQGKLKAMEYSPEMIEVLRQQAHMSRRPSSRGGG